jgi:hypothetical protein
MLARRARVWRVACRSLVLAGFQCFSLLGSNQAFHLLVSLLMKLTNLLALLLRCKRWIIAHGLYFRLRVPLDLTTLFHGRFRDSSFLQAWVRASSSDVSICCSDIPAALRDRCLSIPSASGEQG